MKPTKYKDTEIGMIPEDWEADVLGNHTNLIKGISYRSEDYCSKDEGFTFINLKCVARNGGFREEGIKYYKGELSEEQFVSPGDILIANTDLTQNKEIIGSPLKVPSLKIDRKMCISLDLTKLDVTSKKLNGDFLYYYLMSPKARQFMIAHGNGTTVVHLSTKNVPTMFIPLPSIEEQKRIGTVFLNFDSKVKLNQQINKTLEAIGQALFKRWFVDFEFPNEKGKPYKSSGGKMVDSELGEIPSRWDIKEISDCGDVICGKTPPTSDQENYGEDIPFITIPDMRGQNFIVRTERKLSKQGANLQKNKELLPLAICVSCIATPGLVSLTSEVSHTNQQINSIVCNENVSPYFMYYLMIAKSEQIKTMGLGGTATLNLNTGNFSKIKIIRPSDETMKDFNKLLKPIFNNILCNQKENLRLTGIRDSLLPRLMSGKIRVDMESGG